MYNLEQKYKNINKDFLIIIKIFESLIMKSIKKNLLLVFISSLTILSASYSCARTVSNPNQNKVLQFSFQVKGKIAIRSDITYYFVLYAPKADNDALTLDPAIGPRMNAPDLTKGSSFLEGRLPFIGKIQGDLDSKWTDFFFLTGVNGNPTVGRGRIDSSGNPVIDNRNYVNQNTRFLTSQNGKNDTYQIEFFLSSLNGGQSNTNTINAILGVSESIDTGTGNIFDSWKNNVPFSIDVKSTSPATQDDTLDLVLRRLPLRAIPQIPLGLNPDDINIVKFNSRVAE